MVVTLCLIRIKFPSFRVLVLLQSINDFDCFDETAENGC